MCGVVAALSFAGAVDPEALDAATDALARRGPDGRGTWSEGRVGLGHRRLAVRDLAGGAQPIHLGPLAAVVNGELYDEARLRAELEAQGRRLRSRSDSELVLHLYDLHGPDFLERLRGEFALLLWDGRRQRLLVARDRFGVRPLLYAQVGDALWFASEAKALFAAGLRPRWSGAGLAQCLSFQYLLPGQSLFAGVRSLGPGERLLIEITENRSPRIEGARWWAPELREGEAPGILEALEGAVVERLQADVPLACQLSGGLDSAAVAALAARAGARLPAYTVCFERPPWDESEQAAEIAEALGLEHRRVPVDEAALAEGLAETVAQGEGLLINGHAVAKRLLARQARADGVRVLLTGEGADELALGYAFLRGGSGGPVAAGVHSALGEPLPTPALAAGLGEVPALIRAKGALGARVRSTLSPAGRALCEREDPAARLAEAFDLPALRRLGPARRDQRLWLALGLPAYVLRLVGDGAVMPEGVEDRPPFLDDAVWRAFAALPESALLRGPLEKMALREALAGVLPEAVLSRPKQPFMAPGPEPGGPLLAALRARFAEGPLPGSFDRGALLALIARWGALSAAERVAWESTLWVAASASALQERYALEDP
ncbi:MAG: asparagine synthase (glutamine-hydrolyzing) [Alphaproteobacteria bacterium]|nr:asparagine synthase (glutamine-hydrolyzing) [Alphaproteobacteria bacterium]MCB9794674.1 asparagine synthase (glutamine-hydrolyzing) [Alphaproteobacteria bacterium]